MDEMMKKIVEQANESLNGSAPFLQVWYDDQFSPAITVRGTFLPEEQWPNKIFHNGKYFIFMIVPNGEKMTVELISKCYKVEKKFRKYTGTPDKVIAKIKEWILKD